MSAMQVPVRKASVPDTPTVSVTDLVEDGEVRPADAMAVEPQLSPRPPPPTETEMLQPHISMLQTAQELSEMSGVTAATGVIAANAHLLLASHWHAFHLTSALGFASLAWFCLALCYHRPGNASHSVPTLAVLAPQQLDEEGSPRSDSSSPWAARPHDLRAAVLWALAAGMCLAMVHWALGALPGLGVMEATLSAVHVRHRLLEVMGVGSGLFAACASHARLAGTGGPRLAEEFLRLLGFRSAEAAGPACRFALIAGALSFAALFVQGPLLGGDVRNGGQMLNLCGCDAVLVTAAFALQFGEVVSCRALIGMTLIRTSSLATSAIMSTETLVAAEVGAALLSTCLLAAAATCARLSVRASTSPFAVFALGCQAAALMSALHCAFNACSGGLYVDVPGFVVLFGLGLAVFHSLGLYCFAKALSYPYAGACTAIWGSNVVLVLALEAFRFPALPQWPVVAGVTGVAMGVAVCATVGGPESGEWAFFHDGAGKEMNRLSMQVFGVVLAGKAVDSRAPL